MRVVQLHVGSFTARLKSIATSCEGFLLHIKYGVVTLISSLEPPIEETLLIINSKQERYYIFLLNDTEQHLPISIITTEEPLLLPTQVLQKIDPNLAIHLLSPIPLIRESAENLLRNQCK